MSNIESTIAKPSKVHLGCGDCHLPGFINIDNRQTNATDIVCEMHELPFQQKSLSCIYLCHSLEHIGINSIGEYLHYFKTLLAPAGELYISVPDFEILSNMYLAGKVNLSTIVRAIHGGQEYIGNTHYVSFDEDFLTGYLLRAGFKLIKRYNPIDFLPFGYKDTSTYKISGFYISLNLVALL